MPTISDIHRGFSIFHLQLRQVARRVEVCERVSAVLNPPDLVHIHMTRPKYPAHPPGYQVCPERSSVLDTSLLPRVEYEDRKRRRQ